jgi:hypothetical protein
MRLRITLALITTVAIGCNSNQQGTINLVSNGKSDYTLVTPVNSSPEELRAADFLVYHIQKNSGCTLPHVQTNLPFDGKYIHISKDEKITEGDGYAIKVQGQNLIIAGGNKRGCIYAVSELIEQYMGVRYYSPQYVVIPKSSSVALPNISIKGSSPNTYRNINGDFTKDPNYKDFHRLHTFDDMFAKGYFVHTFHKLVPWSEYFQSHPEYYAFMNGKRVIDQLCLSNEDVFSIVVDKLKKEMLQQPDKQVWSVSQDDNFSYCQCPECTRIIEEEGSPMGPIIRFVNRVANNFPDKVISTLAYQYSRKAPSKTKPLSNVQIMLCTIELSRSLPIATDPRSSSFLKDMEEWGKISKRIFLWDYTVNFAHHISPFPNIHTLQPNIQLFAKNNIGEHHQQTNTGVAHEFSELKSYLLSKLLWNPNAKVEPIIEEFTNGFYGAGAPLVRKYIYHLRNEILKTGEWLDIYGPPTNYQNTFLSNENTKKYSSYFDQAEKAAVADSAHLLHIQTARMPLQYAIMEIGKNDMFGPRGWYNEHNGEFELRKEMTDILESFYQTSQTIQSANVNESGLTPNEYYQSTLRFIDIQVKGNLAFRKTVTANPQPSSKYGEGNLNLLTNGVRGANDFKVHWLGWEGKSFSLILDLEQVTNASTIQISTLYDPKSWILHPASIVCQVSTDGTSYTPIGKISVEDDQRQADVNRLFTFPTPNSKYRYVRFDVQGTLSLPSWHPSAGYPSWVFVDEVVIR